jgi:putative transposase
MRKNSISVDQIVRILAEADRPGSSIAAAARKFGISEQTIYRWRSKYKGMSASEAKRLQVLESENLCLKRLIAEKELELQSLTDILKKKI